MIAFNLVQLENLHQRCSTLGEHQVCNPYSKVGTPQLNMTIEINNYTPVPRMKDMLSNRCCKNVSG